MQDKSTFKNLGRLLKFIPVLFVLICSSVGTANAQCAWATSTAYPAPVLDMPVATVGSNMYAFSGVSNGALVAASNKFDGTAWTSIAALPTALEFASATSDGTNIFIIGGANSVGASVTTNYRYNVATNTYTTMAPCAVGTWNHAAVFLNGKIYKIGGTGAAAVANVEIYDIATNTWTAGAPYPAATSFVAAVALNGSIYAAGGTGAASTLKTYRYDPVANTWNDGAIADLPATRWGSAYFEYRNGFVMAGGYVADVISNTVVTWNESTNTWTTLPNLVGDRARFTGAILNDKAHAVGGRSVAVGGFTGTNLNQQLTCPPLVACTGTPNPGNTFASSTVVCSGTSITLSVQNQTAGSGVSYQWQTAAVVGGPYTNIVGATTPTYTFTATAGAFYRLAVTCGANVGNSTPVQISIAPCTCISPDQATICEGAIQKLSVTGAGTPGTQTATSGTIAVVVPDANATGITTSLPVTLPAGANITSISVNFNMTMTWDGDIVANLVAPDGQVFNLVNQRGGSGDNFVNTTVSTASTNSFATGAAPFTGTFAPDYANAVGPTAFSSTITSFAAFNRDQPSGLQNWRLALRDMAGGDIGTLTSWTITINYNVLPTAVWTGGTFFTNAAATTPYVVGSSVNTVYVQPSTTTTYTATIASGPCAGANNVTVTVLPRPVVTVSPASGCGPISLTASGATTYTWTPGAGLNTTTGPTVTANPTSTTVYSVIGTSNAGCASVPTTATVNSAPTASVISANVTPSYLINEGFAVVPPAGWTIVNNSAPGGTTTWFQGNTANWNAYNGPANSYIMANYQNTNPNASGTISNWLISPVVNVKNGDQVSFWTRTAAGSIWPDRLEARLSTAGASTNVGTTTTSVGDFTTVLVTVNQNLTVGGYPESWTQFTGTVSGVTGTVAGRVALRYFVTDGGVGNNSNIIGVDQFEVTSSPPPLCANVVSTIKVVITGGVGPYTVVYSNGTTNTTINNYTSGADIQVSPSATTTYTIVSVTGANGCVGTGNSGSAQVVVTPAPSISAQPVNRNVCVGGNTTMTVTAGPVVGNSYQWQSSPDGVAPYTNITNGGVYSGATSATLTITGATLAMNGTRYRVVVTGACPPNVVTSNAAILNVNEPAVITTQPVNRSICIGTGTAVFTVAATGNGLTYQWQVSPDGTAPYTNITDNSNYSGATTNTLTITNATAAFANYRYRVAVSSGGCTAINSVVVSLTPNPSPVLTLTANPYTAIYPGQTTTLTVASTTTVPAGGYTWYRNGVEVPGATGNTLVVDVDALGEYTVTVNDANGCGAAVTPSVTVSSAPNDILFIYPSPNSGQFQIRYYSAPGNNPLPRYVNIYDSKGSRVWSRTYSITQPYSRLDVDMSRYSTGIYQVELADKDGNRIKVGRVLIQK
jgi:subtilisin-like proprotein convertase family protein